ncbi:hypothetical protein WAI453_004677 [Rhynchosporium graminicola]
MNAAPALTAEPLFPPPPGAMTPPPAPRKNRSSFRRSKSSSTCSRSRKDLNIARFPRLSKICRYRACLYFHYNYTTKGAAVDQDLVVQSGQLLYPFVIAAENSSEVENINFAAKYICSPSALSTPCLEEWEDIEMKDGSNYSLL